MKVLLVSCAVFQTPKKLGSKLRVRIKTMVYMDYTIKEASHCRKKDKY